MQKKPTGLLPDREALLSAASGYSPMIKTLLIMKIVILLLITGVMGVQASVRSQSVTFSGQDVSLRKVLDVVKKQTGYTVFYNKDMLRNLKPLSITAKHMPLTDFLNLALRNQPLTYRFEGTNIILSDKGKEIPVKRITEEVPVVIPPGSVTGTITGTEGDPLAAVSIRIKGSSAGTATNNMGEFSLTNVPENAILEISSVGYETMEIQIRQTQNGYTARTTGETTGRLNVVPGNQLVLKIVLPKSVSTLDETVVIAYGSVKKRDLTGSVVSIKEADIMATPVNNVMEALQGRVAGMDINRSSGAIGNNVDILLRGNRSIYGDNSPLFIVDGVQSEYNQINPSDIANIDILKDASSTAIYGSAGSNGVVIITTKRGKENKSTVNFDAFYGFSGDIHFLHGMVGDEFVNYRREYYRTVNGEYPEDISQIFTSPVILDAYNKNKWIDWVGEIQNKASTEQKYNLSFSGGTAKTKVYTSFTYTREQGMLSNEDQTRYGVRLNLDHAVASWMKLGTNLNINYTIRNGRGKNIFTQALKAFPLGDPYDEFGNINRVFIEEELSPLGGEIPNQWADNTNTTYATANNFVEFNPLRGLTLRSTLGATLSNSRQGRYFGPSSIDGTVTGYTAPLAAIYNTYNYNYIWENILSYNRVFNNAHNVTVTGITSWAKNQTDNNNAYAQGQELDYYLFYNLAAGTAKIGNTSGYTQKQRLSFAGRVNYSYKGKYLLTLTNRWDGVSHLAEGHKWAAFPAGAVAWRISDETFMDNTRNWLNEMKLRVGYGVTGNSGGMSAYSSQTQAATHQAVSLDGKLVAHTQNSGTYSNPSISWERSYNLNIGLDLVLLKNRIDLAFDVYNTDTRDLLFMRMLPVTSAVTAWGSPLSTWQNIGETNNKGWEITLRTVNIRKTDLEWSSSFSFTKNTEKIVSLPDGNLISSRLFMGYPINTFYDYKKKGIWSTHEETEAALYGAKPGFVRVETIEKFNASGVGDKGIHPYTSTDQMILGSGNPKWLLGVNNTLRYKNFDLSVFTMVRWGQMIESKLLGWYNTKDEGQPRGVDYWTPENQSAYYPRPGITNTTGMSSLRYMDGSFVKVKNITVGFSLPENWRTPVFMNRGRIYATAYNPIVLTKESRLKGTDPETGGSDVFPLYSTYVIGMNLNF